ncbi:MAG: DUF3990 domain-containing protein [Clostridiales bacterium]|jgi:hypothetical protein|nr:DUF3990 domain-containing protein [Clostridiales bacterium]
MHNTLTLYHGTVHDFTEINIQYGKPYKDFGRGFYVTEDFVHAKNIAERNRRIEIERLIAYGKKSNVNMFIYEYALCLPDLENIKVLRFDKPGSEWVNFVVKNRTEPRLNHGYDLIIGATANDDTRITIQNYLLGAYGEPETQKAVSVFLEQIKVEKLPTQWMFASTKATSLLRFTRRTQLL